MEPIFKENYFAYDKEEFLIDADFEFVKVKNLLSKSPKMLKEDPVLSIDYLKIINLIKQKKLLENTSDQFDPTSALEAHHFDPEKQKRILESKEEKAREALAKSFVEGDLQVSAGLENYDASLDQQVKSNKKTQAKEQLRIMKQFEQISEQFTKTTTKVDQGEHKKETASMVRKREKESVKKEKTLSAKLRMKAKKNK